MERGEIVDAHHSPFETLSRADRGTNHAAGSQKDPVKIDCEWMTSPVLL